MNKNQHQHEKFQIVSQEDTIFPIQERDFPNPKLIRLLILLGVILSIGAVFLKNPNPSPTTLNESPPIQPFLAGQIHYSRIPHQYWQHRILTLKAMGLDALSVYVMWNYHQIAPGHFDYTSPDKNLANFLSLARKHNLRVLLRPGPYVCAEWDFGGLPARLLGIEGLRIRTNQPQYLREVEEYFSSLVKHIKPFLGSKEIFLIQIQNQLGSYSSEKEHTLTLIEIWNKLGIKSPFYIEDAASNWKKHYWPGAHIGLSEGNHLDQYEMIEQDPEKRPGLVFGGQVYSGWLTHWGEVWNGKNISEFQTDINGLFNNMHSFSLFVAHGGTNFGLTAGANSFDDNDYMPTITSYDYDAPVDEQGNPGPKFHLFRSLLLKHNYAFSLPDIPNPIYSINIAPFSLIPTASLWGNLPPPSQQKSTHLPFFEDSQVMMYDQGMALYETQIKKGKYEFNVTIHDFALIYVNRIFHSTISREKFQNYSLNVDCPLQNCKLSILVEAMGHVNYGWRQGIDRKGLLSIFDSSKPKLQLKWNFYKFSLNEIEEVINWEKLNEKLPFPGLYEGKFEVRTPGDTFLDLSLWQKGYVWVNRKLLGRYWNKGPQQHLYCPGVWLKQGTNTIYVLDLLANTSSIVKGLSSKPK